MLKIKLLGDFEIQRDGVPIHLPNSRKTRALLGMLLMSASPQRRDHLCDVFWERTSDPRGSLRWSLSKLRALLNDDENQRLVADRERVWIEQTNLFCDALDIQKTAYSQNTNLEACISAWSKTNETLLPGCDRLKEGMFTSWIESKNLELTKLRIILAKKIVLSKELNPSDQVVWADRWLTDSPFDAEAATAAVTSRNNIGQRQEADRLAFEIANRFQLAGLPIPVSPDRVSQPVLSSPTSENPFQNMSEEQLLVEQKVQFLRTTDDVQLAWASVGHSKNQPIIKAANWLNHLELDWEAPIWSPLFKDLARDHRFIRYDERGCGLSDWNVPEISQETFVSDLEHVVDAAGLDKFPLIGISQGAAVSIEYAIRHPERVSKLILFGGYPAGWRLTATPEQVQQREAMRVLTKSGWGSSNPAYRQMFSHTFMPDAKQDEIEWFDEFQRRTTSPANAVRFLDAFSSIDVRHLLSQIRVPTLVIHSRGDQRIPLKTGEEIAAAIPNAKLVTLNSNNHLLLGREPAAQEFLSAVRHFLLS